MFAHYDQDKHFVAPSLLWRLSVGGLASVATAAAAYTTVIWFMARMMGVPENRGQFPGFLLDTPADSPCVTWIAIPVGLPAIAFFGAQGIALFWVGPGSSSRRQGLAWRVLVGLSLFVLGAAGWFAVVQTIWLDGLCRPCALGEAASALAALAVILRGPIRLQRRRRPQYDPIKIRRHTFVWLGGGALAGVAILAAGQMFTGWLERQDRIPMQAQTRPEERDPSATPGNKNFSAAEEYGHQNVDLASALLLPDLQPAVTQPVETSRAPTIFRFRSGIPLSPLEYPLLGRPDAPAMALWVFDYHDPSSRTMYHQIEEARRRFGAQLAIIAVPVDAPPGVVRSLDYVPATEPVDPKDDLTALAIIVAKAKPAAFATFHAFLLGSDRLPTLEAARRTAASLIGAEQMRILRDSNDLQDQLRRHIAIFKRSELPSVPQLHAGSGRAAIMPEDPQAQNAIIDFFQRNLNVKPENSSPPSPAQNSGDAFSIGHP